MENNDKIEKLSAFIDGELSPEERAGLEAALHEDTQLQEDLNALRRLDSFYRSLEKKEAPPQFERAVRKKLERSPRMRLFGWTGSKHGTSEQVSVLSAPRAIRLRRTVLKQKPVWHLVAAAACLMLVLAATLYQLSMFSRNTNRLTVSLNRNTAHPTSPSPTARASSANQEAVQTIVGEKETTADAVEKSQLEAFETDTVPNTTPPYLKQEIGQPQLRAKTAETSAANAPSPQSEATEVQRLSSGRIDSYDKSFEEISAKIHEEKAESRKSSKELVRRLEDREFIFEENEWHERGYSGEETISLSRDAKETSQFFAQHTSLSPILHWKEPVVFRVNDRWYRLR